MRKLFITMLTSGVLVFASCEKFLDVNNDPNNITAVEVTQLLPSVTVNVGFFGASDLFRYSSLIMQQYSGHGPNTGFGTFKEYERYNINDSDVNGQWVRVYATMLSDVQLMIDRAEATGNPHYAGVGKLLRAYIFQIVVDAWGDVPYFNASLHNENLTPELDDDEAIYADLISVIDQGLADINASQSLLSPNQNSTIYRSSSWANSKDKWERFGNTLKLRIYLHYSAKDPGFTGQKITELVNSGAKFMESNDHSFVMDFLSESQRQMPLYSMENGQFRNQFFPNKFIVDMMNSKDDPRRKSYFVPFPYNSNPATYKGASFLDEQPSRSYSRLHSYIYGNAGSVDPGRINADGSLQDGAITYDGAGTARLLPFSEYNFIRAEAALMYGAPGDPNEFYRAGIRASMEEAGVSAAEIEDYLATHGTLTGSNQNKLEQIINEKYVASFAVLLEPWTDYRRTGFPRLTPHKTPAAIYDEVPRSLFYAQTEANRNPHVSQKSSMLERVFWDVR